MFKASWLKLPSFLIVDVMTAVVVDGFEVVVFARDVVVDNSVAVVASVVDGITLVVFNDMVVSLSVDDFVVFVVDIVGIIDIEVFIEGATVVTVVTIIVDAVLFDVYFVVGSIVVVEFIPVITMRRLNFFSCFLMLAFFPQSNCLPT